MYRYLILILVLIIFGNVIAFCPQEFRAPPAHIPKLNGTAQLQSPSFSGEETEAYREVKQLAQGYKRSLEYDLQTFKYIASGLRGLISKNYNFGEAQKRQQRSD